MMLIHDGIFKLDVGTQDVQLNGFKVLTKLDDKQFPCGVLYPDPHYIKKHHILHIRLTVTLEEGSHLDTVVPR